MAEVTKYSFLILGAIIVTVAAASIIGFLFNEIGLKIASKSPYYIGEKTTAAVNSLSYLGPDEIGEKKVILPEGNCKLIFKGNYLLVKGKVSSFESAWETFMLAKVRNNPVVNCNKDSKKIIKFIKDEGGVKIE